MAVPWLGRARDGSDGGGEGDGGRWWTWDMVRRDWERVVVGGGGGGGWMVDGGRAWERIGEEGDGVVVLLRQGSGENHGRAAHAQVEG